MTLRTQFLVYLVLIHLVFAAASAAFLRHHPLWLLAVEVFFVVSFWIGVVLVRKGTEPLTLVRAGAAALRESDFTTRFRPVGQAELDELIEVYNRMADHLRDERVRSEESERFLERVLAAAPSGVVTLDLDERIATLNAGAERLLGVRGVEARGRRLGDLGTAFAATLAGLGEGDSKVLAHSGPRRVRAQRLAFMDRGFSRGFLLLDELTEELRRSEKAAYDKLIRMMSHEVNNTSGAVSSLLESSRVYAREMEGEQRQDYERAMTVSIDRLDAMNRFMRAFADVARLGEPRKEPIVLPDLLGNLETLHGEECSRRRIAWVNEIDPDVPRVRADGPQLEQALINVIRNAMEAIGEDGTVTLRLEAGPGAVRLEITDTGSGIPDAVREHLFTPFYTTKTNGQGIGLTLVREILIAHGWEFALENQDTGARFVMICPL